MTITLFATQTGMVVQICVVTGGSGLASSERGGAQTQARNALLIQVLNTSSLAPTTAFWISLAYFGVRGLRNIDSPAVWYWFSSWSATNMNETAQPGDANHWVVQFSYPSSDLRYFSDPQSPGGPTSCALTRSVEIGDKNQQRWENRACVGSNVTAFVRMLLRLPSMHRFQTCLLCGKETKQTAWRTTWQGVHQSFCSRFCLLFD